MSTPNVKTRQLVLPEILKDELSGTSALSSDSEVGDSTELNSSVKAATRRSWKKHQLTGETLNPPTKKKLNQQKTPLIMASNTENTTNTLGSEVELTPELLLLEKRLQSKFDASINKALKLIQEQLNKWSTTSNEVVRNKIEMTSLKQENSALKTEVVNLKESCDKLENKSLECNLIISGIPENRWETDDSRVTTLYRYIANTIEMDNPQDRYNTACNIVIECCKRLGPRDTNRTRPICVEFASKYEADRLYANRFYMEKGVFVDREYSKETERICSTLRPILKAAKTVPEYKKKCRMEGARFILDGKSFTKENLHKLPEKISSYNVSTKTSENVISFFGELSPFSNFHPAHFVHTDQENHCAEQLIQHEKAKLFGDSEASKKILKAKSGLECKQIAYDIENYDHNHWIEQAPGLCKQGIRAKYE